MGHIINPVTTRLGLNIFWNSRWTLNNNYNYKYLHRKNIFFFQFINWFFQKKGFNKNNVIFSHYYLFLNSDNIVYLNLYHFIEAYRKNRSRSYFKNVFKFLRQKKRLRLSYKLLVRKYSVFTQSQLLFLYWNTLTAHWNYYIANTNNNIKKINISFINLTFRNINTHTILKYIKMRLISKYSLNYILKPILRDLHLRMRYSKIVGYKILCAGRFTRKQIAAKMWFKQGPASVNNFENLIKYSQIKVRLKYGVCGIKIWINYGGPKIGRATQKLDLAYPIFKYFKFNLLSTKTQEYLYFYNNSSFYFLKFFNFKKRDFFFYNWFISHLLYNKMYGFFYYALIKELNIFLKNKNIKSLVQLPFITLHINNSKNLKIKVDYDSFFLPTQSKQFIYK